MQQLIYSLEVSQVRLCQLPHIMVSMAMCPGIYGSSIELDWHNVRLHHTVGHFFESSFLSFFQKVHFRLFSISIPVVMATVL